MNIYQVIKKPIVTEKSQLLATRDKYVFQIDPKATKKDVERAVGALYKDIEVGKVAIVKTAAKKIVWRVRNQRPQKGTRSAVKKAIVTLSKGKIELFEKSAKGGKKG